jgi:hypothetical protein
MSEKDDLDPTAAELEAAAALRKALEEGSSNEDADLLRALKLAHDPPDIDGNEHEAIVARALRQKGKPPRGGVVVRVVFGVAAVAAMAAGLLVVIRTKNVPLAPSAEFKHVRSTQELFDKPFESSDTSARVDRIAILRGSDFRENKFARWGVR